VHTFPELSALFASFRCSRTLVHAAHVCVTRAITAKGALFPTFSARASSVRSDARIWQNVRREHTNSARPDGAVPVALGSVSSILDGARSVELYGP